MKGYAMRVVPRALFPVVALVVALVATATAADRPVAGDRLILKDPATNSARRRIRFTATRDPAVAPGNGADPRSVGATLEVSGSNPGDGATGVIQLPAGSWVGLGNPDGSRGYRFKDPDRRSGIRSVTLKSGARGGSLVIV